jgi:hypothetical protein
MASCLSEKFHPAWISHHAGSVTGVPMEHIGLTRGQAEELVAEFERLSSQGVPNLEAELGLALMFASMIPIYWRAGRKRL